MKKLFFFLLAGLLLLLPACAAESNTADVSGTENGTASAETNGQSENIQTFGLLDVVLPDDTWSGKSDAFETIHLYKEGHYKDGDPTVKIFVDEKGLEDSMAFAESMFPALPDSGFELSAGPYACVGNRAELKGKTSTAVIDRVFYPINDSHTLRFQVFVSNGSTAGLEKDDPEILSIIQSVIDLNGYGSDKHSLSEKADADGIAAAGEDLLTSWTLYGDGTLRIGGSASMTRHSNAADYAWAKYRDDVTSIVFDTEIAEIYSLAFKKFTALKSVEIPSSVKKLWIGCFEECTALESAVLPEGLEEVEYYIFAGCRSLKEITIPGSLKHIANYAFDSCDSLETAWISSGVESLGYDVFSNCPSLKTVYLPKSVRLIDLYSFYNTGLQDVYYEGSESDFRAIEIMDYNDALFDAKIHYNASW